MSSSMVQRWAAWRRRVCSSGGFSLVEVLVVVAIMGVIAAIAIPTAVSQMAKAADASVKTDLTMVSTTLQERLLQWRGTPPYALNVCNSAGTYPLVAQPSNSCSDGQWSATRVSDNAQLDPTLEGTLSSGVKVQGRVAVDGTFCLDGTSSRVGSDSWYIISSERLIKSGSCYESGWSSAAGAASVGSVSAETAVPDAPSGLSASVDGATYTATVTWDATAGVPYTIRVTGQTEKTVTPSVTGTATCVFPAVSCAGPATGTLTSGAYTVTVRAANGYGIGTPASSDFVVTGNEESVGGTVVNLGTPNPAPVAKAADVRSNLDTNPSVETNVNKWDSSRGAVIRSSSYAYSGTYSLEYTTSSTSETKFVDYDGSRFTVTPDDPLAFSAYMRAASANTASTTWRAAIYWYDAGGSPLSPTNTALSSGYTAVTSSAWTRIGGAVTVPAGASTAFVRLITQESMTGGQKFYVDAALLEKSTTVDSFFDGSTSGGVWTGTPNGSVSLLSVSANSRGRVKVTWTAPVTAADAGVTYSVSSTPDGGSCTVVGALTCYVIGLDDDTSYTFTVKATTASGTGTPGVSNSVRTPAAPASPPSLPSQPISLTATPAAPSNIVLAWDSPSTPGGAILDYIIEQNSGGAWTIVNDGVSNARTATLTGLTKDTTYIYRVYAVNSAGSGAASSTASAKPGYPADTATVVNGPDYYTSSGSVKVKILQPSAGLGITFTTGYGTSAASGSDPYNLPGSPAVESCDGTYCTFTWTGFNSKIGSKYYFFIYPKNSQGYGDPAVLSINTPDANSFKFSIAQSYNECPSGYPNDMGNGYCRDIKTYTYYVGTLTGTRWKDTSSCYAYCGPTWPDGSPTPGHCCWGGSDANNGLCCTSGGYWESYTYSGAIKDATPAGYTDSGTNWYKEAPKVVYNTYKVETILPWSDNNNITKRYGEFLLDGGATTNGSSADMGRCAGVHDYSLKGIGGTTSGQVTFPCN